MYNPKPLKSGKQFVQILGNIITEFENGPYDVMVQGNNCFHTQKSGLAPQIVRRWPEVLEEDYKSVYADPKKLGSYYVVGVAVGKQVMGIYTQFDYGRDKKDRFCYDEVREGLKRINNEFAGKRFIFPKIGAGLCGGDWGRIKEMILEELKDIHVTFCYFPDTVMAIPG